MQYSYFLTPTGSGGGSATAANQAALLAALQDTSESDETQSILTDLIAESDDTQTLLTALETAINDASDEAVIAKLTELKTAIEDTTESDETQALLSTLIQESNDSQTLAAATNAALASLQAQQITNADAIIAKIQEHIDYIKELQPTSFTSTEKTTDHTVPAGAKQILVTNIGESDITIAGGRVLVPGASWGIEASYLLKLPSIAITVDAGGTNPKYVVDVLTQVIII